MTRRVLTQMAVLAAKTDSAGRAVTITLHWQPVDDLGGAYVEVLTFDGATKQFRRARAHYEAVWKAKAAVEGPW
jgi:hypothetical protein